jgi:hypothetical protein
MFGGGSFDQATKASMRHDDLWSWSGVAWVWEQLNAR